MKLTGYILTLAFITFSLSPASAKENKDLMRASYYYTHYAYIEAIPYYEKVASELNDPIIYTRLADCYSVTNNMEKALGNYAKAVNIKGCNASVLLKYAQLLMQQMQYEEAIKWLTEYLGTNSGDKRAANLVAACTSARSKLLAIPPGTATLLAFNGDGSEFAPALWHHQLVFASDTAIETKKKTDNWTGKSYYNIYTLPCDEHGNCGTELNKLAETKQLNNKYHDGPCTFSADGKEMYYTRSRYNGSFLSHKSISNKDSTVLLEIMIASNFDTASKKFKTITAFEHNSKEYSVAHPSVSPNGKLLAFSSTKPKGMGGSDIYICKRAKGAWSVPENAGNIVNTEGEEVFPYWADDTVLFFSSDGQKGLGGLDIYNAIWDDKTNTFSTPENIGIPINSSSDDISLAMFADGRSIYFSSGRPAAKGSDNIYFYRREKLFLQLNIIDATTKQPLQGVAVSVIAPNDILDTIADNNGSIFKRLYPENQYTIKASKDGYGSQSLSFIATSQNDIDTIIKNIILTGPVKPVPVVIKTDTAQTPVSFTKLVGIPEVDKIYEIGHFHFAYNSAELTDTAMQVLDSLIGFLAIKPTMRIQVRAHTDCRGGDAYNMILSKERALSVVNYLSKKGIAGRRLSYIGFGMRLSKVPCPICEKCTEEEWYLNRVLEFKVLEL
jgi:peptidoglycan-associated lipoprotein